MERWLEVLLIWAFYGTLLSCCGFVAGLWTRRLVSAVVAGVVVSLLLLAIVPSLFFSGQILFAPALLGVPVIASLAGRFFGQEKSRPKVFGLCISAIVISAVLAHLITLPFQERGESGGRAVCLSNLKQIGLALAMYAEANQGHLPSEHGTRGFNYIYRKYVTSQRAFRCPEDKIRHEPIYNEPLDEDHCSYVYIGGDWQPEAETNAVPICWDKDGNHRGRGGLMVLFNDGSAYWLSLEQWQKIKPN